MDPDRSVPSSVISETDDEITDRTNAEAVTAAVIERLEPFIPMGNMPAVETIMQQVIGQVSHHSGPLPRAEDLERYNQIDPGFAERIFVMAEREQAFRHDLPRQFSEREYRIKSRGQHYAVLLVALILVFAGCVAWLGNTDMAGKVAIWTLVGIVSVMVGGRVIDAQLGSDRREAEEEE